VQVGAAHSPSTHDWDWHCELMVQPWPAAQAQPPPQSVTASLPFLTPSEQVGAWHLLSLHTPDEQSEPLEQPNVSPQGKQFPPQLPHICPPVQLNITSLSKVGAASSSVKSEHSVSRQLPSKHSSLVQSSLAVQICPEGHRFSEPHVAPPQSMPTSSPFLTPSSQLAGAQTSSPSTDVSQLPEEQSEFTAQGSPSGHETQFPPQSIAVSAPFCSPSVQVASMHCPSGVHMPVSQCAPIRHPFPGAQVRLLLAPLLSKIHTFPPQSTSVSLPFFFPSLQVGAAQLPEVHTWEVQSEAAEQDLPVAQGLHEEPPQSVSVSSPFFTPSVQIGLEHTLAAQAYETQSEKL